jgi:hypothetical protein
MESRNWIGLLFILVGVILQPLGWIFFHPLQLVYFILIFIGAAIFVTQKYIEKSEEAKFDSTCDCNGHALPADINDSSGWGHGGPSESWASGPDGGGD